MNIDKILIIASAIIRNNKDEILLLKRNKTKTFQNHWQLPEGKLEEKESPYDALKREIKEELSAEIERAELKSAIDTTLEVKGIKYLAFRLIYSAELSNPHDIKLSAEHSEYGWFKKKRTKQFRTSSRNTRGNRKSFKSNFLKSDLFIQFSRYNIYPKTNIF